MSCEVCVVIAINGLKIGGDRKLSVLVGWLLNEKLMVGKLTDLR